MSRNNTGNAENNWRKYRNEEYNNNSDSKYVRTMSIKLSHMYPDLNQKELYDNLLKIHTEIRDYNSGSPATSVGSRNNNNNIMNNDSGYNANSEGSDNDSSDTGNTYPGNENNSVGGRRRSNRASRKARKSHRKSRRANRK